MTISMGEAFGRVDVDLWSDDDEPNFRTRPLVRSLVLALAELDEKAGTIDDSATAKNLDAAMDLLAERADLLLEPIVGKGKASTLIRRKWKADEVTPDQIGAFLEQLTDQRPT